MDAWLRFTDPLGLLTQWLQVQMNKVTYCRWASEWRKIICVANQNFVTMYKCLAFGCPLVWYIPSSYQWLGCLCIWISTHCVLLQADRCVFSAEWRCCHITHYCCVSNRILNQSKCTSLWYTMHTMKMKLRSAVHGLTDSVLVQSQSPCTATQPEQRVDMSVRRHWRPSSDHRSCVTSPPIEAAVKALGLLSPANLSSGGWCWKEKRYMESTTDKDPTGEEPSVFSIVVTNHWGKERFLWRKRLLSSKDLQLERHSSQRMTHKNKGKCSMMSESGAFKKCSDKPTSAVRLFEPFCFHEESPNIWPSHVNLLARLSPSSSLPHWPMMKASPSHPADAKKHCDGGRGGERWSAAPFIRLLHPSQVECGTSSLRPHTPAYMFPASQRVAQKYFKTSEDSFSVCTLTYSCQSTHVFTFVFHKNVPPRSR